MIFMIILRIMQKGGCPYMWPYTDPPSGSTPVLKLWLKQLFLPVIGATRWIEKWSSITITLSIHANRFLFFITISLQAVFSPVQYHIGLLLRTEQFSMGFQSLNQFSKTKIPTQIKLY